MTGDEKHDLARRLVISARSIGEPCGGRQCWLDLRDECKIDEAEARHIVESVIRENDPPRRFEVHKRRRWTLVAEYLSNGQQTARWFRDEQGGGWYVAESWKRPNLGQPLNTDQVAYAESVTNARIPGGE